MSIEILTNAENTRAVLTCNTKEVAFGPIFYNFNVNNHELTAREIIERFLHWIPKEARQYSEVELIDKQVEFHDFLLDFRFGNEVEGQ